MQEKSIQAKMMNLKEILETKISIPAYKRSYVWGKKEVEALLEEILGAFEKRIPLYVGSLVFCQNEIGYEVVDGVQRIGTFVLLFEVLGILGLREGCGFMSQSTEKVQENKNWIALWLEANSNEALEFGKYVLENIQFSCTFLYSLDECFTLFDDLNSKGKKYETYELIKIYHLGKMSERGDRELIESYAKRFDEIAQRAGGARIRKLFYELLSLARMWIKNKSSECIRETSGAKKEEFEKEVFEEFCPKIDKRFEMFNSLSTQDMGILRDFGEGRGFFEYLFYFDSLLDRVEAMIVWRELREGDEGLCKYLRFIYEMMMLIYLDKFRDGNLEVAHLWIFRVVYSLVLQKEKITRESARDWGKRLLAILYHSGSEREFISRIAKVIAPQKEKITKPKLYKIAKAQREQYAILKFGREL